MSDRLTELQQRFQANPSSLLFAPLAEEHRRRGEYNEAIRLCRAGLARHPAYVSARVTLGRALMESGKSDEAQRELELVVAAAPENLAAIRGLAEIHERRGSLEIALGYYRRALNLAPHDATLQQTIDELGRNLQSMPSATESNEPSTGPADLDAILASLGQPAAPAPPLIEKLLDQSTSTAPPSPVTQATLPQVDDLFAEIERNLRAYDPARLDPVDAIVLDELEVWLEAILADRDRRTADLDTRLPSDS